MIVKGWEDQKWTKPELSEHVESERVGMVMRMVNSHQVKTKLGVSWEEAGGGEKLIVALQYPMLLNDLKDLYGWNNASKFKEKYINPLMAEGLVEMTVPNKPASPNQKYYLTEKRKGTIGKRNGRAAC